jgi:hypothetical protein
MTHGRLGFLIAVLFAMCVPAAHAQAVEHESGSAHETTHESHQNVLSFFVGVTHEERRDYGVALGIAYERLLNESFSVGVIAEHTFGDLDFWVYAVPFGYRAGPWKFYVAPGIEDGDHGSESLVRLGAEYAFEAGTWEISPQLAVDFVDGDQVLVLGVVFGWGF